MALFQKMIKQRQESVELYEKGGRAELAAAGARRDRDHLRPICRKQMSDAEAGHAISALLQEINAETMKDMGRAMAALQGALRRQDGFRQGQRQDQGTAEQEVAPPPGLPLPACKSSRSQVPPQARLKVFGRGIGSVWARLTKSNRERHRP